MTFLYFHTLPSSSSSSFFAVFCLPSLPPLRLYLCLLFPDLLLAFTPPSSPPVYLYCLISELETEKRYIPPRSIFVPLLHSVFFLRQYFLPTSIFSLDFNLLCYLKSHLLLSLVGHCVRSLPPTLSSTTEAEVITAGIVAISLQQEQQHVRMRTLPGTGYNERKR